MTGDFKRKVSLSSLRFALAAGLFASVAVLPQARGELVYEEDISDDDGAAARSVERSGDRDDLRGVIRSSDINQSNRSGGRGRGGNQDQNIALPAHLPQGGNTSIIQVQPQMQSSQESRTAVDVDAEASASSKSELLRRQRVRTELRNEDMLQERLEELRLRDERRRTDDLLTVGVLANKGDHVAVTQAAPEQVVVSGTAAQATGNGATAVAVSNAPAYDGVSRHDASWDEAYDDEKTRISIIPRAGVSGLTGSDNFDVKPHYSLGVGLDVGASENLTFEIGYTYSEYGISVAPSNPFYAYAQSRGRNQFENLAMKQNVIDLGLKLHLLNRNAKFRPFVGGGGAYAKSYINYDEQILRSMDPISQERLGRDYELGQFLGFLMAGFDVKVSKSVSIGGIFKYYTVLSSRESAPLAAQGFMQPGPGGFNGFGPGPVNQVDPAVQDKDSASAGLAKAGFYTVQAGANFTF